MALLHTPKWPSSRSRVSFSRRRLCAVLRGGSLRVLWLRLAEGGDTHHHAQREEDDERYMHQQERE